jgi:hypothetical protein
MSIISWIYVLVFLLCGLQVTRLANKLKRIDLYWLGANFLAASLGNLFSMIVLVPVLGTAFMVLASICIVMFVHLTFYRDRKSPYLLIIGLLLALGAWQVYNAITNPSAYFGLSTLGFGVVWGWQAFLSFRAGRAIAKDTTVEDWVKARYWLWFSYTFAMFVIMARMLLPIPYANFENWTNTIITMLAVLVQYITWVMPEPVRRFLNRNYQPVLTASPNELMAMAEKEMMKTAKAR